MFERLFGRRKREEELDEYRDPAANWAFLCADMHSHFIPGIDDGAKTLDDSVNMLRAMAEMGYKTAITTPHVMVDYYPNTSATILAGLEKVQAAVKEKGIDITVRAAAEYYMDEYFINLIDTEPLLTIRDKEVLMEFSMMYEPPMLQEVLFKLLSAGYKPIIAHPERYVFFHNRMDRYEQLKDIGCYLQLNMLSLSGYYGRNIKLAAEELLAKGMYDYTGSDMHHERHAEALKALAGSRDYSRFIGYPFKNRALCSTV